MQFCEVMEGEGARMESVRFQKKGEKREAVLKFSIPAAGGFLDLPKELNKALAIMESRDDGQLRADFSLKLEKQRVELFSFPDQPGPSQVLEVADLTTFSLRRAPFPGTPVRLYFRAKTTFEQDRDLGGWAANAVGSPQYWRMAEVQGDLFPGDGDKSKGDGGAPAGAAGEEPPKRRGRPRKGPAA